MRTCVTGAAGFIGSQIADARLVTDDRNPRPFGVLLEFGDDRRRRTLGRERVDADNRGLGRKR